MRITLLGSSGNRTIPWGACKCRICVNAREAGGKDCRMGNSTYIHDEGILIDTPESIFCLLAKGQITNLKHIFISHWHPDHTAGLRVLQTTEQAIGPHEREEKLHLYMSQITYDRVNERVFPALERFVKKFPVTLHIIKEGDILKIGSVKARIFAMPEIPGEEKDINFFMFENDGKRVLIAPDETKYMQVDTIPSLDLLIKECGIFPETFDGNELLSKEFLEKEWMEITWKESVEQIRQIGAKKTILTEIEELFQRTHAELEKEAAAYPELNIIIGYDGLTVEV